MFTYGVNLYVSLSISANLKRFNKGTLSYNLKTEKNKNMRYLIILIALVSIFTTSCTSNCEKTVTGTVVDHITQESIANAPVILTGRKSSRSGIGSTFRDYETTTDNMGNFEISTNWSLDRWDQIQINLDEYKITSSEYAVHDYEVCGENHAHLELHRLADFHLKFADDNSYHVSRITIITSIDTYSFPYYPELFSKI